MQMFSDADEAELQQFFEGQADNLERLSQSRWCVAIMDKTGVNAILALQVGAAMLMDKPLIMIVPSNYWVPDRLRRYATAIIMLDDPRDPEQMARAKAEMVKAMQGPPKV
jgi:hypothetical protein